MIQEITMKRFLPVVLTAAVAAIAFACGSAEKPKGAEITVSGIPVETVASSEGEDFYEASGTVRSATTSVLSAKVVGSVKRLLAREGDHVRAGQLLIEIDDRDMAAQLGMANASVREANDALAAAQAGLVGAEANRKFADATYERFKALLEKNAVSRQEFDEVEAKRAGAVAEADRAARMVESIRAKTDQARAGAAGAQAGYSYTRIVAPFDGIVSARFIDAGSMAAPGMPLMSIEQTNLYRLETTVDESQVGRVKKNDRARVHIDALGRDIDGVVSEVVPSSDAMSRSYVVRIDLPRGTDVRSGLFGTAYLPAGKRTAITVPQNALVRQGQLTGVYVVGSDAIARLRLVTVGKPVGNRIEILSGVSEGERIVAGSDPKLADGVKVSA